MAFDTVAAAGNEIVIFGATGNAGHTEAFTDVSANGGSTWQVAEVPNSGGASERIRDEINGLATQGSSLIGVGSSSSYLAMHTTLWQVSFPQ
jgi:hypothetical protein